MKEKKSPWAGRLRIALFFAALWALLVVSLLPGLRSTTMAEEKREAAPFPEFSAAALFNGTYFRGIEDWFGDTFPGRAGFLKLDRLMQGLYGVRTVEIRGEVTQGDEIPDAPFIRNS